MKVRIHHQEIRFRLSPRDIAYLEKNERLQGILELTHQASWSYALQLNSLHESKVTINETGRGLTLELPLSDFRAWLKGTEIEWTVHQSAPELILLVEKDLKPNRS